MILLARHGHHAEIGKVLSGRSEIPLSALGRAQASRLADRLAALPIARVCSSPRRRALETAAIVAERHGLPVEPAEDLDEIDFGVWAGQSFAALDDEPEWRAWNAARGSAATPSGETMRSATSRALRQIEALATSGTVLCVSHCDIIRGIVAHYLDVSMDRLLSFDIDPASCTTIEIADAQARIIAINERVS